MLVICELKSSKPKSFPSTDLLTYVNLTVTEDSRLEIAYEEFYVIESNMAKLLKPKRALEKDLVIYHSQFASDDLIARIVVHGTGPESSQVNEDGLRRSSWTRTAVFLIFNSSF